MKNVKGCFDNIFYDTFDKNWSNILEKAKKKKKIDYINVLVKKFI